MKRLLWTLLVLVIAALGVGLYYKGFYQYDAEHQFLVIVKQETKQVKVSANKGYYFNPRMVIPGDYLVFSMPRQSRSMELTFTLTPPYIDFRSLPKTLALHCELILEYKLNPDNILPLFYGLKEDMAKAAQREAYIERLFRQEFSQKFNQTLRQEEGLRTLAQQGTDLFDQSLEQARSKLQKKGIEIQSLEWGGGTNIRDAASYLRQVYFAPGTRRQRRELLQQLQRQKQQFLRQKNKIANTQEQKNLILEQRLKRLKKYAKLLRNYPEAYKVMLIQALNGQQEASNEAWQRSVLLKESLRQMREEKTAQDKEDTEPSPQKEEGQSSKIERRKELKPGEFYTR